MSCLGGWSRQRFPADGQRGDTYNSQRAPATLPKHKNAKLISICLGAAGSLPFRMEGPREFRFSIDRGGTFTDVYAEFFCADGTNGSHVMKLLSEDPGNYPDAPREGIRRVLEAETGIPHPRDTPLDTSRIHSIRMGTTVRGGNKNDLYVSKRTSLPDGSPGGGFVLWVIGRCPGSRWDLATVVWGRGMRSKSTNKSTPIFGSVWPLVRALDHAAGHPPPRIPVRWRRTLCWSARASVWPW